MTQSGSDGGFDPPAGLAHRGLVVPQVGEEIAEPEEVSEPAPVVDLMAALKASLAAAGGDAPEAEGDGGKGDGDKGDDQLSIEQGRLRGVKGGGEGRKSSSSKAKAPAKKSGTQRRRKAS